jgi:hypothetical protein
VLFHILDLLERGRRTAGYAQSSTGSPISPTASGGISSAATASVAADPAAWLRRAGGMTAGRLDQMDVSGSYLAVSQITFLRRACARIVFFLGFLHTQSPITQTVFLQLT